jgi:hypothetical protein
MPERFGYNALLPENVREIFMWLCQDVVSLNEKWNLYIGLYSDPETASLLSDLARGTFQMVEESLRNDMAASISRLCDRAHSFGHEHVSFKALSNRLTELYGLDQKVKDFVNLCEPVVQYRHRRIGHNDLDSLIRPDENVLPGIRRSLISEICEKAGEILNFVLNKYEDAEMIFETSHVGGAESLIYWLRIAKQYDDDRRRERRR